MFFTILNFTLSGAIAIIGILTIRKASTPNEVVFASLPLLFALHQFTQGFVWLGMYHLVEPRVLKIAESIFVFYAQGFLQFLIPFALWLIEPSGIRKLLIGVLTILGGILMVYTMWGLSVQPTSVSIENNALVYINPWTDKLWIAIIYVLTTCGSLILSSSIAIQLFGWLNLLGLTVVYLLKPYAFTSLWCLYAAAISVLLYFYFVERRIAFLQRLKEKEYSLNSRLEKELQGLKSHYPRLREKLRGYYHTN